jgi:hypothetical protein
MLSGGFSDCFSGSVIFKSVGLEMWGLMVNCVERTVALLRKINSTANFDGSGIDGGKASGTTKQRRKIRREG